MVAWVPMLLVLSLQALRKRLLLLLSLEKCLQERLLLLLSLVECLQEGAFGRRVSSLAGGEKRDSEEYHLLKTVASGGPWHSYEQDEEALLPGSKIGPKCRRLAWAEAPVASRGAK